jgi:D-glycero-D-manno-heptose 1,7-bisphosphate phosphatase
MVEHLAMVAFIDRDGTIVEEKGFLSDESDIEILEGSVDAIKLLRQLGFVIAVVSNQSGIARGLYSEIRMIEINEEIFRRLEAFGARPDFFFYCPHHSEAAIAEYRIDCDCRKPKPGMVRMLQQLIRIDLVKSVSVGDRMSDVLLCKNLGGRGILVRTGYGTDTERELSSDDTQPDYIADTLLDAALWVQKARSFDSFC